jgi:protein-tyrosine phosphatase
MHQSILFLCTGNYYRSRFAEAVFNHHAEQRGLDWRAFSRGLYIDAVPFGDISAHTRNALFSRRIDLHHTGPKRVQLSSDDLEKAQRVIALDEDEHHPMVREQFPAWLGRITFWNVGDLPLLEPQEALALIESNVLALLDTLEEK